VRIRACGRLLCLLALRADSLEEPRDRLGSSTCDSSGAPGPFTTCPDLAAPELRSYTLTRLHLQTSTPSRCHTHESTCAYKSPYFHDIPTSKPRRGHGTHVAFMPTCGHTRRHAYKPPLFHTSVPSCPREHTRQQVSKRIVEPSQDCLQGRRRGVRRVGCEGFKGISAGRRDECSC